MTNETQHARRWAAAAAPLVGLVIGFLASLIQATYAPVGLFPLLVGVAIGAAVGGSFFLVGGSGRRGPFLSATLAAGVCLASLHYLSYLHAKAGADADVAAHQKAIQNVLQNAAGQGAEIKNVPIPPSGVATFREYIGREWDVGRKLGPLSVRGPLLLFWWIIDGLLLWVGATVAALVIGGTPAVKAEVRSAETNQAGDPS